MSQSGTFEGSLQIICEKIRISDADRKSYTEDAQQIENFLMDGMKKCEIYLNRAYKGLSLTGSYLDSLKIDVPDEFDLLIKLKMLSPIKVLTDHTRPGFMFLETNARHRIADREVYKCAFPYGYINRMKLQSWIREIIENTLNNSSTVSCNERKYKLIYPENYRGYGVAHTIQAVDVSDKDRVIYFDFTPVFEFDRKKIPSDLSKKLPSPGDYTVFAVPQRKAPKDDMQNYTFMLCAPHYERDFLHDKMNLKNSLRLMKKLRDAHGLNRLTSYMLKSVYLKEIDFQKEIFWQQSIGVILIHMLERLHECLQEKCIPFYWDEGENHLDRIPDAEIEDYERKMHAVLQDLRRYKKQSIVKYTDMARIFGI